jgi:hypothetical protein
VPDVCAISTSNSSSKNLRVPDRQNHRAQLLELLAEEHGRRSKKLAKSFDADTVRELRKRLRRTQAEM